MSSPAAFYFDFASPEAYLAAERVLEVLPFAAEWIPVRAHELAAPGPSAFAPDLAEVERLARQRGLQPIRWPDPFPFDSELALRAATYAKSIGRVVAFSLAAFRQAYAGGHDLGDADVIVIAASACEMHPRAVLQALERSGVEEALAAATAQARERDISGVPAVWQADGRVLHGDADLERVA